MVEESENVKVVSGKDEGAGNNIASASAKRKCNYQVHDTSSSEEEYAEEAEEEDQEDTEEDGDDEEHDEENANIQDLGAIKQQYKGKKKKTAIPEPASPCLSSSPPTRSQVLPKFPSIKTQPRSSSNFPFLKPNSHPFPASASKPQPAACSSLPGLLYLSISGKEFARSRVQLAAQFSLCSIMLCLGISCH